MSFSLLFFREGNFQLPTFAVYEVAIKDPVFYGLPTSLDPHLVELLRKGCSHQCPTPYPPQPFWSLQEVLDYPASPLFSPTSLTKHKLEKAIFPVVL